MLIGPSGRLAGCVSGGCLERDLVRRAAWLAAEGPRLLTYDTAAEGDEEDRAYLGCGGTVHVLVEALEPAKRALLEQVAGQRAPSTLVTVLSSSDPTVGVGEAFAVATDDAFGEPSWRALAVDLARQSLDDGAHVRGVVQTHAGQLDVLAEHIPPRRALLVAGIHHDVAPVVELARAAGWEVTLAAGRAHDVTARADDRVELARAAIAQWLCSHPHGAFVIMNHSVALDRMCLGAALAAGTRPYVGLLGPVDRTRKIVDVLRETEGASDAAIERVRAPIGVPLGGEGPAAVALSIVAELEQTYARRVPTRRVSPPAADGARRGVSRR
jgi:xanthine/CO dehydrogenase XdhC/CoxF family maturation factor